MFPSSTFKPRQNNKARGGISGKGGQILNKPLGRNNTGRPSTSTNTGSRDNNVAQNYYKNGDEEFRNYYLNVIKNNNKTFSDKYQYNFKKVKSSKTTKKTTQTATNQRKILDDEIDKLKIRQNLRKLDIAETFIKNKSLIDLITYAIEILNKSNSPKIKKNNNNKIKINLKTSNMKNLISKIIERTDALVGEYILLKEDIENLINNIDYYHEVVNENIPKQQKINKSIIPTTLFITKKINIDVFFDYFYFTLKSNNKNKRIVSSSIAKSISLDFRYKVREILNNKNKKITEKIISLFSYIVKSLNQYYRKTNDPLIIHTLQNSLFENFITQKKLGKVSKTIRKNNTPSQAENYMSPINTFTIKFNNEQTAEFIKLIIKDMVHDNDDMSIDEISFNIAQIINFFGIQNINEDNIINSFKNAKYLGSKRGNTTIYVKKAKVDEEAKKKIQTTNEIKNTYYANKDESMVIKYLDSGSRNLSGKNLKRVKMKVGNQTQKFYKKFNVLINANLGKTMYTFISKFQYNKNKKIAHKILCRAQLVDPGIFMSPMNPTEIILNKMNDITKSQNLINLDQKNLVLNLQFGNNSPKKIELKFNQLHSKYVYKVGGKNINVVTARNASEGKFESKMGKFFGDFGLILKCISESKKNKRPIVFSTIDAMAANIYLFMCKTANVKPRLMFLRKSNEESSRGSLRVATQVELYIYGMNDILSKRCEIQKKNNINTYNKNKISRTKSISNGNRPNNKNLQISSSRLSNTNNSNTNNRT